MEETQQGNNNYQDPQGAVEGQDRLSEMQGDVTITPAERAAQEERVKFEKYVQNEGAPIPANYKSAGDWFDSLKEAQAQYTQARQEISSLKQHYNEKGVENPNYVPPEQQQQEAVNSPEVADTPRTNEELRLNLSQKEEEVIADTVTEELWDQWRQELVVSGDISPETQAEIKKTTGFNETMINDYINGQKAQMREAYQKSGDLVGGTDRLNKIFKWAEDSLSVEEQANINIGLSGPTYEVTLKGLEAMYNSNSVANAKAEEPQSAPNTESVSASDTGFVSYTTKREFMADRNNPRFKLEPAFREAVEQRMLLTNFNTLPD
jgi:hypothetical protein